MKKKHLLMVKGASAEYGFDVWLEPSALTVLQDDGIQIFELGYTVPAWVVDLGLARPWMIASDLLRFRNPWRADLPNPPPDK